MTTTTMMTTSLLPNLPNNSQVAAKVLDKRNAVDKLIEIVNRSIVSRNENAKDDIRAALYSGKALIRLRAIVDYGNWEEYIVAQTEYKTARSAQHDMKFYAVWERVIDDRFDGNIDVFINALNDNDVAACKSAMALFTHSDVPELALDLAMQDIQKHGLNMRGAEVIIQIAHAINALSNEQHKTIARNWYKKYNVRTVRIIESIPKIIAFPDLFDAINLTGYVDVPAVDDGVSQQIALSEVGHSDIELVLKNSLVEHALRRAQARAEYVIGSNLPPTGIDDDSSIDVGHKSDHPSFSNIRFVDDAGNANDDNIDAETSSNKEDANNMLLSSKINGISDLATGNKLTQQSFPIAPYSQDSSPSSIYPATIRAEQIVIESFEWLATRKGTKIQIMNHIEQVLRGDKRYKIVLYVESNPDTDD